MLHNQGMTVLLLPGMDGTGRLFKPFVKLLPQRVGVRIIKYPVDVYLNYEQLAGRVRNELPAGEPFIIVAESYSGPIALTLAAQPVGDLLAVVLVSSFVSRPLGVFGGWVARLPLAAILRVRAPRWVLRWLLMDAWTPPEMLSEVDRTFLQLGSRRRYA